MKDITIQKYSIFWGIGCVVFLGLLLWGLDAVADVRLPSIFSSRVVLQQGKPLPVWGWATPGEKITISIGDQKHTTAADVQGRWRVTLSPLRSQATHQMLIQGNNRIVIQDIWVGEVWLCSGQSNMWWPVRLTQHARETLAQPQHPWLRLFTVPITKSRTPVRNCGGSWQTATSTTVRDFSAVCFHFGQFLQKSLGVPVGLIHASVGGTRAEAWTPHEILANSSTLRWVLDRQKHWETYRPTALAQYKRERAAWQTRVQEAKRTGKPQPHPPWHPPELWHHNSPAALFNAMIFPLIPFAMQGVLWYQGESNIPWAHQYQVLFSQLIQSWRERWKQGPFPFLFVQLAPFRYHRLPVNAYNRLCETQVATAQSVTKTAMVNTHDITDIHDIHPRNKREVGRRLFLAASHLAYGNKKAVYSGPVFQSIQRKGNRLLLSFLHTHGGLVAKGGALRGFEIASLKRKFVAAQARIVGNQVEVWSPDIQEPVAVRLAWTDHALHNLFNGAGFPASTFRSDRWP